LPPKKRPRISGWNGERARWLREGHAGQEGKRGNLSWRSNLLEITEELFESKLGASKEMKRYTAPTEQFKKKEKKKKKKQKKIKKKKKNSKVDDGRGNESPR